MHRWKPRLEVANRPGIVHANTRADHRSNLPRRVDIPSKHVSSWDLRILPQHDPKSAGGIR